MKQQNDSDAFSKGGEEQENTRKSEPEENGVVKVESSPAVAQNHIRPDKRVIPRVFERGRDIY